MLHGLTFTVERGTLCGLLGPSGCGKTTLMRAVVGVQANVGGRVDVLGQPAGSPDLRLEPVASAPADDLAATIGPTLDRHLTGILA